MKSRSQILKHIDYIDYIDYIDHLAYISKELELLLLHGSHYCMKVLMISRSDIFSSSHFPIFSFSHLLIFSSSHFLIFSFLIFSFSHFLIFSSSHLLQGNRNYLSKYQVLDESALKTFVRSIFQSFSRSNWEDYGKIR
jgi:hypothetical protein